MKTFVKQSHLPYMLFTVLASVSFCIAAIGVPLRDGNIWGVVWRMIAILLLTIFFARYVKSFGIYVDGEQILYKSFLPRHIDVRAITAIRVTKAVWIQKYGKDNQIVDRNGDPLYTMIFVKEYKEEMRLDLHDMDFRDCFKKQILCFSTYDQSVIDYLLTLNPNIIVF